MWSMRPLLMSPGGGGAGDASEKAAEAQLQATREALQLERETFNRQLQAQAPGRNIGNQALATLGGLYGFNPYTDIAPIDPFPVGGDAASGGGSSSGSGTYTQNALLTGGGGNKLYAKPGLQGRPYGAGTYQNPTVAGGGNASYTGGTTYDGATGQPVSQSQWMPSTSAGNGQSLLDIDPGYAFRKAEQQKWLDRQASAAGGLYSGGQLKAAQRYGGELASQEFSNAYNRLASLAGLQQTGTQGVSNALTNFSNTSTGLIQRAGDARASGYINAANAQGNRQSPIGGALSGAATGASIGSVVPVIGTGWGALGGAALGLFGAL